MTLMITDQAATEKQITFILDLAKKRDWHVASGQVSETVMDVLGNVGSDDPKFIARREASAAIDWLLSQRPLTQVETIVDLKSLPLSRYALPRKNGTGWDFFEIVERKNGRRFLNRLVGSPGDWKREFLTRTLQGAAARHIAENPHAAAVAYATQHGRCAVCDAHLSDPESIARSMGPVCAKRF